KATGPPAGVSPAASGVTRYRFAIGRTSWSTRKRSWAKRSSTIRGDGNPQSLEFVPMAIAREAEPVGSFSEVREAGLDREDLLGIYHNMVLTRGIEERGHILYRQGKIPGSFYTGRGNEAASVGVAAAMGPDDVGTPLHRNMGVHVVRGVEPWRIFAQYMGR